MLKKIGIGLLAVIIIIQFFRIDKENPEVIPRKDFITQTNPPENIKTILKTACYDCHSHETKYPWYSNISPINWWLKDHIDEGREHLNFSEWADYPLKKQQHKLEECWEEVGEGEMPLESYLYTHSEADLTQEERDALIEWFKSINLTPTKEEKPKELGLNNGNKWQANIETTDGIKKMIEIAAADIDDGRLSHYAAMGERLNLELNNIFSSCNMKGEAHEQLHLFILPLKDLCEQLELVDDETNAMILQKDILKQLNLYSTYFETTQNPV